MMFVVAEVSHHQEDSRTLAEIGEFGLIAASSSRPPPNPRALVGIVTTPPCWPSRHAGGGHHRLPIRGQASRWDWAGPGDVGHKAAARSLADLAAMGAEPRSWSPGPRPACR